ACPRLRHGAVSSPDATPVSLRRQRWQVEHQDLGALAGLDPDLRLVAVAQGVAGGQALAIDGGGAAKQVDVGQPPGGQGQPRLLGAVEQARVQARVLVHAQRAFGPVRGHQQAQAATLLLRGEALLLVAGGDPGALGQDPDLQEVGGPLRVRVELGVGDPGAGAHALDLAREDALDVAHRVAMHQRALQHVADDLHVAVAVGAEALAAGDPVLVDHPQRAPVHVLGVEIAGEGEAVPGVQPTVVGVAAFAGRAQGDQWAPPGCRREGWAWLARARRQASKLKSPAPCAASSTRPPPRNRLRASSITCCGSPGAGTPRAGASTRTASASAAGRVQAPARRAKAAARPASPARAPASASMAQASPPSTKARAMRASSAYRWCMAASWGCPGGKAGLRMAASMIAFTSGINPPMEYLLFYR